MSRRTVLLPSVLCLILLATLAACAAPTDPARAPTVPPTAAPTSTRAASPTPMRPTPDFLDSPVADGFILSSSNDPDCQLPCWQDLRIGKSTSSDVQSELDELYGFDGSLNFFANGIVSDDFTISYYPLVFPDKVTVGYEWYKELPVGETESSVPNFYYAVVMVVDETTNILEGMLFSQAPGVMLDENANQIGPGYFMVHTPQQLIQLYGKPDWIYSNGAGNLVLFYRDGIISQYSFPFPTIRESSNGVASAHKQICLDEQPIFVNDYLVAAFDELAGGNDQANLVQQMWLRSIVEHPRYGPIEAKLGISTTELTALAMQDQERPCIVIDYGPSES